jgi:hypothetical protein
MLGLNALGLLQGEQVVVERVVSPGVDAFGDPLPGQWVPEMVYDVLVAPGGRTDLDASRPEGVEVKWTLHFPKGYPATLRGARVVVRGQEPAFVVGDPQHYTEGNTPGAWSMPVELTAVRG